MSGIVFTLAGRWMFGRWYNHVTMYATIWSFTLALFEIRLLPYYPLEAETWIIIISGWFAFFLGSLTIVVARNSLKEVVTREVEQSELIEESRKDILERNIEIALWIIIIVSIIPAIQQWMILIAKFGSITNAIVLGNIVYSLRVRDTSLQGIPYLGSFALTGTLLSGIYTAMKGKLKLIAVLPLLILIVISIAGMGRSQLVIAMALFMSGYFFYKTKSIAAIGIKKRRLRNAVAFVVVIALTIGGAEIVRSNRGTIENIPGATKSLQTLRKGMIITPSIYLYTSIHFGVLNQYLKHEVEHPIIGANTFAPIWRIVAKTGLVEPIPEYQQAYRTPVGSNTATYLRELHADFGYWGILLFPYILGILCSVYWFRTMKSKRLLDIAILAHLYVIVAFSNVVGATRLGYWLISLVGAVLAGYVIDKTSRKKLV